MLDTLIEALTAFTDRQTDKSKDQAPKQHYLGRKNNLKLVNTEPYRSKIPQNITFTLARKVFKKSSDMFQLISFSKKARNFFNKLLELL